MPDVVLFRSGVGRRENESRTVTEDNMRYGFENDSEMDIISQISECQQMTPVSWTEVGSTVSDER